MKINFIRTLKLSAILCAVTVSSAWSGLLGITPGVPNITFVNTNSAATSYSPATGLVTVTATPQLAMMISGSAPVPVLPPRSLTIALQVDQSGNLVGGVAGDDLVLTGTVYGTSYAGTLLTGEIVGFGIQDSASTIDYIDLRLKVTGGSMASLFTGNDIGVSLAMENSTFDGSFNVSFQGAAKGNLGPIPPLQICSGTIGDFIWNDANRNGVQDAGETGIDNVSVSLKDNSNTVVATKLSGPNGAYLFTGLCAGDYNVVVDTATIPAGFVASPILQGGDPVRDSNPNGAAVNLPTGTSSELTIDFGYNSPCSGSVGDLVWHDQNRNGIQDPGEPGLGTITVNLIDSLNNTPITSTTTDGSGKYLFNGLCAGNYRVEAVAPAGFVLSTPLQGGNIASDSNPNPSEVVLASDYSGEVTIDFGFNTPCTGSIGDFVWNDLNRNGIQNSDEPGINNIRVWLKDSFSNLVATATTTGNGFYQFGGLCAGTYRVEVDNSTLPSGMGASPANATDGTKDSNNIPAAVILDADNSSDPTVDFGYYSPCSGSIGDMVWLDANRDGIQNFGETGINGVTVTLRDSANVVVAATTSGLGPLGQAGFYAFSGLCSGSYTVEVVTPAGLQISDSLQGGDPATDSNGSPASVYLDSDHSADPTIDFAFNPPCAGSIGNLVWDDLDRDGIQDPGEPGLDGVTVKLLTSANAQLSLTTTAGGGLYRFDGLCAGDYRVEVVPPAGRTASPELAVLNRELDSNPNPFAVNLPADTSSDQSIDFGFNTPCSGSIGNLVWHDKNRDGIQDELEPGISGASVKLKNASGTVIATTNSDQQGGYLFGGLCSGDYSVEVVTPAGFVPSSSFQGSNVALDSNGSPVQVSLTADDSSDRSVDFGFNTPCAAVIGDFVWNDLNQNGIQDSGEPGIAGVVVNLRDSQHTLLRTTNTKADGSYEFIGLCSGDYKVEALTPASMTPTPSEAAGDPEKDSNFNPATVTISSDSVWDSSIDFGFFKPCTGSLGNFIWNDINNNGIQEETETGLSGAIVTLNGTNDYGMQVNTLPITTTASGFYQFNDLCKGSYRVTVIPPAGYNASPSNQGGDLAKDSNGSPATITLATDAAFDQTVDFGYFLPPVCIPCLNGVANMTLKLDWRVSTGDPSERIRVRADSLTGQVLYDSWSDSIPGDGLAVGTVFSFDVPLSAKQVVVTVQGLNHTNETLKATFSAECDLINGQYSGNTYIKFQVTDFKLDGALACTPKYAKIGDYVWKDLNGNGVQDVIEPGMAGVKVELYNCDTGALVGTTTTDVNGYYFFSNLAAGNYKVKFYSPTGYGFTLKNQGADSFDSDADPVTGVTDCFYVAVGDANLTIDAGLNKMAGGCTFTIGYWKNHAGFGPQADVVTPLLPQYLGTVGGSKTIKVTSAKIAYDVFGQNVYGTSSNGITKLYAQLLAAKLNIKAGADSSSVASIITAADSFLAAKSYSSWSTLGSSDKNKVISWQADLDNYNNGISGPGHCESQEDVPCVDIIKKISVDGGKTWLDADTEVTAAVRTSSGTVQYKLIASNCGQINLNNIDIDDPALGISKYVIPSLAAGASATLTSSQIPNLLVSNQCKVSGSYENVAMASANYNGTTVASSNSAWLVCKITSACIDLLKDISVDGGITWKTADTQSVAATAVAPHSADYRITVKNCGNAALSSVAINDPYIGINNYSVGTLLAGASKVFTYKQISRLRDADACTTAGAFVNTAIVGGTYGGVTLTDSDAAWLVCSGKSTGGCSYTQGYWKTHTIYDGQKKRNSTWDKCGGENSLFFKTGQSWYEVLMTNPASGNAYYILAHQYIAAYLNKLSGADTSAIDLQLSHAAGLLSKYDGSLMKMTDIIGDVSSDFISTASVLDQYNNGDIGPGHCK